MMNEGDPPPDIEQCERCKCFHTDNTTGRNIAVQCKTFNPRRPCRVCKGPVIGLAEGGPDICPLCDAGHPPPKRDDARARSIFGFRRPNDSDESLDHSRR